MKRLGLPVFILVLLGAFACWWYAPTQVVKRRTQTLLHTLTLESGTGRSGRQMGVYSLNALLASQVEFEAPPSLDMANGIFDRSEIESAFSWLCDQAKQSRFELQKFHGVHVDGEQAEVAFALEAQVELPGSRLADGSYEVTFLWRRENDVWRLVRAHWMEAKQ